MTASEAVAPPAEALAVLAFWFGELEPEQWWTPDPALDAAIAARFAGLYEALAREVPDAWLATPEGCLAAVIVLDQFPRNMFRGDGRAFATDQAALSLAKETIGRGLHEPLDDKQKGILFMPFQHSEDREVQARSVALFASLDDPEQLEFAEQHKQVIDRFGRFPHRNSFLGRATTPEERDFLKKPGLFW